ncbi:hypothetical protein [Sphingopyxis sp. L1A2A]|uniref:hypothetical protein n=1 Tax=Sphingopyxis sp. L1A2A TaxID=2502247 RepID=UPI0010FA0D01|nr:hypothetical protein [Sphingopyxis sp. L1A2A]
MAVVRAQVIPDPDPGSRSPRRAPSSPIPDQVRDDVRALSPQPPVMRIFEASDISAKVMG